MYARISITRSLAGLLQVLVQRRVRNNPRIEPRPLVLHLDMNLRGVHRVLDRDRRLRRQVLVPVPERVGDRLFQRQLDRKPRGLGVPVLLDRASTTVSTVSIACRSFWTFIA